MELILFVKEKAWYNKEKETRERIKPKGYNINEAEKYNRLKRDDCRQ